MFISYVLWHNNSIKPQVHALIKFFSIFLFVTLFRTFWNLHGYISVNVIPYRLVLLINCCFICFNCVWCLIFLCNCSYMMATSHDKNKNMRFINVFMFLNANNSFISKLIQSTVIISELEYKYIFQGWNYICKCSLQSGSHFVQASLC